MKLMLGCPRETLVQNSVAFDTLFSLDSNIEQGRIPRSLCSRIYLINRSFILDTFSVF